MTLLIEEQKKPSRIQDSSRIHQAKLLLIAHICYLQAQNILKLILESNHSADN